MRTVIGLSPPEVAYWHGYMVMKYILPLHLQDNVYVHLQVTSSISLPDLNYITQAPYWTHVALLPDTTFKDRSVVNIIDHMCAR